jgi:hypothetical protein
MAAQDKKRKGKARVTAAQAYKLGNRAAVNKARTAKRVKKALQKKADKLVRRRIAFKPERGSARALRRAKQRAATNAAIEAKNFDSPVLRV